ncbi:hypothetical protein [Lentzea californiensis]|uniref:hypothetical protein n=1 Tax=Lentzea californiensis TaxID=438851 RepID=UPI00216432D6|nr:hypothetical protein [Lentzea californiensis]MCR3746659.1 hypothetical protein [Lentzea californiensis]
MTDESTFLLLLLASGVAFMFAVLLWKLLITTVGIATTQWAVVTGLPDHPALHAITFAVPALLAAFTLLYLPRIAARGAARPTVRSTRVLLKGAHR